MEFIPRFDEPQKEGLRKRDLLADPIEQFQAWFRAAEAAAPEPNAMTLSTIGKDGAPAARIVLLKHVDQDGFVFFTNYESCKGRELAADPRAALVFFWPALGRQVRVTGRVTQTSQEESKEYFATRPLGSRLGAWASHQSEPVPNRETLEARHAEFAAKFADGKVPLPPHWGGFRLAPETIEFWQSRVSRLHDRFLYRRAAGGQWALQRLSP
jgi:pyridoxamine 5'-phosphate oxidase